MAERVAGQRINCQQAHVHQQNQSADAYSKSAIEDESAVRIVPKKAEEDDRRVEEVSVKVLKNERECGLAAILARAGLPDRTGGWIQKECAIVRFPIVVAGGPESQRPHQNQQRRRKWPPPVMRINQRRIKRREIRSPFVKFPFEGPGSCIESESTEKDER